MGYLICDKCGGYYKLEEGESADDFDVCECGAKLRYVDNIDEYLNNEPDMDKSVSEEEYNTPGVIYEETIYLAWLIVVFLMILVGTFIFQSLAVPDEAKPIVNIVLLIVILVALFSANFLILRIKITQEYLSVSCGIIKNITPWDDITDCNVDPNVKFNGYGIRYGRMNGKRVQGYVMGNPKVMISLNKGKYDNFIFTTKNPEEICKLIKEQIDNLTRY